MALFWYPLTVILSTIVVYLSLALCAVGIALLVREYDLYLREPVGLLFLAVLLGAAAMWAATLTQVFIIRSLVGSSLLLNDPFLAALAGTTEELGKLAVVAFFAVCLRRWFNEPLDGLVYGSFAGIGTALIESVWVLSGEQLASLPPQEPVRLAGHVIMGGIGGFGMGLLTFRTRRAFIAIVLSYFGAAVLHTLWDVVAFSAANHYQRTTTIRPIHSLLAITLMFAGMIAYRWLVAYGARLTRAKLQVCDLATKRCPPF